MMRFARRASLLVVFVLLTSTALASAQNAWVLWRRTRVGRRVGRDDLARAVLRPPHRPLRPAARRLDPETGEFTSVEGPKGFATWEEAEEAGRFLRA